MIAARSHLFPSRTEKLSSSAPKVMLGQLSVRIGRRRDFASKFSMIENITSLPQLFNYTLALNKKFFPENKLVPIMGGGKKRNPRVMFVFINPTGRNISSDPNWEGQRVPWAGTKQIWRIFHKAGLFDDALMKEIESTKVWGTVFLDKVYRHIEEQGFYITNLVKWTGFNADLPNAKKINLFLPILRKEIQLVRPNLVVCFGLMPFTALTKEKIKLSDYYAGALASKKLKSFPLGVNFDKGSMDREGVSKESVNKASIKTNVIPCYFPVGRGNPRKAVDILRMLAK